jgi:Immunity protein 40
MDNFEREYPADPILKVGIALDQIGIRNWGLTKSQALRALVEFEAMSMAVLGGDVYEAKDGLVRPQYANWYCDPLPSEPWPTFVTRSIAHCRSYIEKYKIDPAVEILFAIVPQAV